MDIYTKFIHNFLRAKAAIELAKQSRPVFAKFLEVSVGIRSPLVATDATFSGQWANRNNKCLQPPGDGVRTQLECFVNMQYQVP